MIANKKQIVQFDPLIMGQYVLKEHGSMSHLKLQKLLYYIQAYHLAYFDSPIFKEKFQAWAHGPVMRRLFDEVKDLSILHNEIYYVYKEGEDDPTQIFNSTLTEEQKELVNEVLISFSEMSGMELENLTHSEPPWQNARLGYSPGDKCSIEINEQVMKNYYAGLVYGENT